MKKNKPNTIHSQRFAEAQKRWALEDQQREERKARKAALDRLEGKETRKERLDREYRALTKDSSQENIRINGGDKMNKRPFALCAPNTGWKINPSETTWDTHYRVWKEEITAKKQAGICWIESNSKYTTPTYEYKKVKTFEATPTYHWLVTNAPRNPFARSLMKYYKRHNQLTEKQLAAIEQNLKRPHH